MIGNDLSRAADLLRAGEVVAIPTETVYGLAANALDPLAVSKIYAAKERPRFNPLIVHLSLKSNIEDYVSEFPAKAVQLAEAFWPGPMSLLLNKRDVLPEIVTAGLDSVVVRKPAHPIAQQLLEMLDFPLAAPSANPFKQISPTKAEHVERSMGDRIAYILEGGPSVVGLESTILDCRTDNIKALRLGGLSLEQIEKLIGPIELELSKHSNPQAPGQMDQHYSPAKGLYVVDDMEEAIANCKARYSLLLWDDSKAYPNAIEKYYLSRSKDLVEAASNLFEYLHRADEDMSEIIFAERVPNTGLGRAINDRLIRASH